MLRHPFLICVWLSALLVRPVAATVIVPMTADELAAGADLVVRAEVLRVEPQFDAFGHIERLVDLRIEAVVGGNLEPGVGGAAPASIQLHEPGGQVGDLVELVAAAPDYQPGERVLVYIKRSDDGTWHTYQMALGKHHLETDEEDGLGGTTADAAPRRSVPGVGRLAPSFRLASTGTRFFEADEGATIPMLLDSRGDSKLGFAVSRQLLGSAFAAWNGVGTRLQFSDAGTTTNLGFECPGPHKVLFDDPQSRIDQPVNCRGILAVGGVQFSSSERKHFADEDFLWGRCATLTFANGWNLCDVWNECNVAEIATHELGHILGLGHSSEREIEPIDEWRDATMFFRAHFDGRCAGLRADDEEGLRFVYPAAQPPTITTPAALPRGKTGLPYNLQLAASGGSGEFTWSLVSTNSGLSLDPSGILAGSPAMAGNTFVRLTATDSAGDSHTKVFTLAVDLGPPTATPTRTGSPTISPSVTPSPTHTPSPTATDSPSPSPSSSSTPTPSPSPSPSPCKGDCNTDGEVTIDELIALVQLALAEETPANCTAGDANADNRITIDEILAAVGGALGACE